MVRHLRHLMRGPWRRRRVLSASAQFLALAAVGLACAAPELRAQEPPLHPLRSGLLVIESVRDSTQDFRWVPLPELGRLSLLWEGGALFIPADLDTGTYGVADLTVPYGPELQGASEGRRLVFAPGRHRIEQTLLLADGRFSLVLTRGILEVGEGRIIYRRSARPRDQRAQYLLLAGILLLTVMLMMRLRRRLHGS